MMGSCRGRQRKVLVEGGGPCSGQRHGKCGGHLWHASEGRYTNFEANGTELTMSIFIHHLIRSTLLPRQTACAAIAVVRAFQKKSPSRPRASSNVRCCAILMLEPLSSWVISLFPASKRCLLLDP